MVGAMSFQYLMLVQLTWVGVLLISGMAAAGVAAQLALPNCPDRHCKDVEIPYPFGITDGCYLNPDFALTCDHSSGQIQTGNAIVTNISIEQGQIDILMDVAHQCFDEVAIFQTNKTSNGSQVSLTAGSSFTISYTQNVFMAVGCDTYAFLRGLQNSDHFSTGCMSECRNITNVVNGSCSGIGCCQVEIPPRLKNITWQAYSFNDHSEILSFNPCSHAFVVKNGNFSFSSDYLSTLQDEETLPMVLDWAIGNETCENSNSVCGRNSICNDPENIYGYRCTCKSGYEGNPYLLDGCQDIDECSRNQDNCDKETQICSNSPGGFNCSCREGYEGDGSKTRCRTKVNQSQVISTALGISIGLLALVVGSSWVYWALKRRKLLKLKERFFKQNGGLMFQQKLLSHRGSVETDKIFSAKELEKATNNYDKSRILGQGGYGTVYKGVLPNNKIVAIKKSKISDQRQIEQFINEVIVLTQINYRNVVKLLGCCLETEVPLLVYEFITNGTLSDHVHNKSLSSSLSWEKRLKIATEIAGALAYLHSSASMPIIHRDVKTTNILLDDNYMAKVSDFGASRLVPLDQTQLNTLVQGTFGYIDPEYFHTSQLTKKSDVYSFGVVVAELLTGKEALSFNRPESDRNLAMYFVSAIKEDRLLEILEDHIVNEGNIEELKEVANLAKMCLRVRGEDRPSMKEVAMQLEGLTLMGKHPWGKANLYTEETEYLLDGPIHSFNIDVGTSTTGYDSMSNDVQKPVPDDGTCIEVRKWGGGSGVAPGWRGMRGAAVSEVVNVGVVARQRRRLRVEDKYELKKPKSDLRCWGRGDPPDGNGMMAESRYWRWSRQAEFEVVEEKLLLIW
ncbi:hypothetical protein FH972_027092 [Carpinus fangiana]|uniref:Protein kinase domain-containing protein n=1 Tax=Carpinus fangiana TaxID=176857 RepID=A0A5N6L5Z3_9ROSI|nr:hypothetical protein FH972_027092 [Carpinus fangiana]